MDRSDEKRHERTDEHIDERDDTGSNPLGIGNANPPRDHVPDRDEDTVDVEDPAGAGTRAGTREIRRSPGATSIDMGAGGTGTEVEREE